MNVFKFSFLFFHSVKFFSGVDLFFGREEVCMITGFASSKLVKPELLIFREVVHHS